MARQLPCGWMNPTPPPGRRLRPRSLAGRIALALGLALVVFVWAFDWNWCRPLIHHYVMSHSGRDIEFDDLHVRFEHGLDPTIEFRGLTIQNAPWAASKAPFIHAGRIAANISWRTLGSDMIIVNLIELEDAQVDMERQADGVRNWRLSHPDDRGPPHARVLALDARRSQLHTIHGGLDLEMDAQTTPLAASATLPGHPDLPLTRRLVFKGTYKGHAFDGDTQVSDVLTFGATPRMFALRGSARLGALRLAAAGLSNDLHALGDVDVDATLSTEGAGALWPLPEALARVRPLVAQGHVTKSGDQWTGSRVHLRAGRQSTLVADVGFTGNLKSDTPRRTLKATLRDVVVDLDDVSALRDEPANEARASGVPALSARPVDLARLREFDADIDLRDARFIGNGAHLVQTLRAHATLADGVLQVNALDAGLADGHVTGTLRADASGPAADVAIDVAARALHVDQLSARLAANAALIGAVDGRASLRSHGESPRALVDAAHGSVTLSLADGASVSKRVDAKLGLDGGEWLRTLFDKSARVPVQCAAVTLAVDRGVATSQRFLFETADTALAGQGSVNFVDETLAATLTPAHKKLALLSLDKAIHAEGPWHDLKISLKPPADATPLRCPGANR
jgi:uncharacterized protein involved in outer membrane biogenesis